jgi:hypothetical protein
MECRFLVSAGIDYQQMIKGLVLQDDIIAPSLGLFFCTFRRTNNKM